MKTAISVPEDTFARVSERAQDLGMSRSEFFARAARHYLDALDAESLTGRINSALACQDGVDEAAVDAVEAGRGLLVAADDQW